MADRNRYTFNTELTGFVNIFEDSGKFNNRCFSFIMPPEAIEAAEKDREELLAWAGSKAPNPKRVEVALPKWDDEGLVKFSYGAGDGSKKAVPAPIFVDTDGAVIDEATLKAARKGTKVRIIVQQSPYVFGSKVGTKFKVLGVQIIELVTGSGAVDSGDLSVSDVAALFGAVEGFKQGEPQVRQAEETTENNYDF
jgi:hypothetical protein